MSQRSKPQPPGEGWVLPSHLENREKLPVEELRKYSGRHVAWNWEGTAIVASGADFEELCDELETLKIPISQVVCSFVDPF